MLQRACSGLVAAGVVESPFQSSDVVTTTTHKSLRGPRGGAFPLLYPGKCCAREPCTDHMLRMHFPPLPRWALQGQNTLWRPNAGMIFYRKALESEINQAVFPGLQGGPHNHTIAGLAVALKASPCASDNTQTMSRCKARSVTGVLVLQRDAPARRAWTQILLVTRSAMRFWKCRWRRTQHSRPTSSRWSPMHVRLLTGGPFACHLLAECQGLQCDGNVHSTCTSLKPCPGDGCYM